MTNNTLNSVHTLQQSASDPKTSCWVNASAGSGKTKVLIDRIIRMLLNGAKPERILCLTFSRAAAFEMHQRLQRRINDFSKFSKEEIIEQLRELGEEINEKNISNLTSLAEIIKYQPVIIQTVHSFCQTLLQQQFGGDILKNVPRIMENFEERTYLNQAFQDLLENTKATTYIEEFLNFHSDQVLFDYLCKAMHTAHNQDFLEIQKRLSELLDINNTPEFPAINIPVKAYLKNLFNIEVVDDVVEIDHEFAQTFLTQKGTVRSKILNKELQNKYPDAEGSLKIYGEQLANYYSQKRRFDHLQKSLQFWHLQQLFRNHYKKLKQTYNLWDFADLIEITLQTLQLDIFDQVLLDLNYSIEHILVDEAQDTSVMQWQVIEHLVNGLFQSNAKRTLFVVGDEKQSIYSFQGADINVYTQIGQQFKSLCQPWKDILLNVNFRSGKTILSLIDQVFEKNSKGLGQNISPHTPWHNFPGNIEILPLIKTEKNTLEEWPIFETYAVEESDEQQLCTQVIDYLQKRITDGLYLECEKRNACLNDVMILMRKRGSLMANLTALCGKRGIAYTALDPKNLMQSLVVQDLLSIVEFMLMPFNDLNLAGLLKSPWIQAISKIDEDALFELCHKRNGSLWQAVEETYIAHAVALSQLLQSQPTSTYGYFQIAYNTLNIQDEMLCAFMEEVFKRFSLLNLGIRELVNHLYDFPPFFTPESKLDDERGVMISTVHGSKGLEAPIVVIIDNGEEPNIKQDIVLYDPVAKFWFLKPPQSADTILTEALKSYHQQAIEHEHNRLFYVGLTRAKECLVLAAIKHEQHSSSWYWQVESCIRH